MQAERPSCSLCEQPSSGDACLRCDRALCVYHLPSRRRRCEACEQDYLLQRRRLPMDRPLLLLPLIFFGGLYGLSFSFLSGMSVTLGHRAITLGHPLADAAVMAVLGVVFGGKLVLGIRQAISRRAFLAERAGQIPRPGASRRGPGFKLAFAAGFALTSVLLLLAAWQLAEVGGSHFRCRRTYECQTRGQCTFRGGECFATSDAQCARSEACRSLGACVQRSGECVASNGHCRRASTCKGSGLCTSKDGACVAGSRSDCRRSEACRQRGHCAPEGAVCAASSAEDCRRSGGCAKEGKCLLVSGACTVDRNVAPDRFKLCVHPQALAIAPDGQHLAVGAPGRINIYHRKPPWLARKIKVREDFPSSLSYAPDGGQLAMGCWDGTVRVYDAATGRQRQLVKVSAFRVYDVAFSPDGELLAAASRDYVRLWSTATWREVRRLRHHREGTYKLSFSPDGTLLAVGGWDGSIRIWRSADGKLRRRLGAHRGLVTAVIFRPDGAALITAGNDGAIRRWGAASSALDRTLVEPQLTEIGESASVLDLAISPDGKTLAAVGPGDTVVRLRSASSGEPLRALKGGHETWVRLVAFSRDGTILASADHHGVVRLWDLTKTAP